MRTPVFEPQGSAGTRNPTFGVPRRGAPEFVFHHPVLLRPPLLYGWLVLFIEALVLFPNIEREGSQQWRANLKGAASINYPDKSSLRLRKALVVTPSWAP